MGMVRQWQELLHGNRLSESYMESLPDFVKLAESFGATGLRVEKPDEVGPYDELLGWFFKDNELFLGDTLKDKEYKLLLDGLPGINALMTQYQPECKAEDRYFYIEFLLWGLEAYKKLNKYRTLEGFQFKDSLGSYISKL